jgi:hypothetical protein
MGLEEVKELPPPELRNAASKSPGSDWHLEGGWIHS